MGTLGLYDYQARADVASNAPVEGAAAAPAQPIALPRTFHPPAGARLLSLVLAAACPGAPAASAPKLSAYSEDFHPDGLDTRLPYGRQDANAQHYGADFWNWKPDRSALFGGELADAAAERVTSTPFDVSAALLTLDITDNYENARLDVLYEDRAANELLRFTVARFRDYNQAGAPHLVRLAIGTERSEGGAVVLAEDVTPAGDWPGYFQGSGNGARTVRLGVDTDGTVRLEVQRTAAGATPVVFHGLTGVALPPAFAAVFNAGAVYVHYAATVAAYNWLGIANVHGSRPVGAAVAVGSLPATAKAMQAITGGAAAPGPYVVPPGRVAVVDSLAVSLLVADGGTPDPAHPHAVADVWARVLVDGAPMEGLGELRPAPVLALGVAPVGSHFRVERRGLALTLGAGQQLGAELVARDSNAAHVVALELDGWTFDGEA